jgi:hypothetical protein
MNVPGKIWARGLQHMHGWHDATEHETTAQTANECGTENPFIEYILFALHQSAIAARDATIARLQANLDRWSAIDEIMPPDYKDYWQGDGKPESVIASLLSLKEREAMAWAQVERLQAEIDRQVEASKTAIARLQARLDAGPTRLVTGGGGGTGC